MAHITAGVATSHVPLLGVAVDQGKTGDDYFAPIFAGYDWTREWEQEYAAERDLPVEGGNEGDWSIDTNLWSRSVEGKELEEPSYVPGEEIYEWTSAPSGETLELEIGFEDGYPVSLDGESIPPVELVETLNEVLRELPSKAGSGVVSE